MIPVLLLLVDCVLFFLSGVATAEGVMCLRQGQNPAYWFAWAGVMVAVAIMGVVVLVTKGGA
mgnify:CR=1 FL=1